MPDLDAFEAEVKAKIKQLSAKDPSARRKAAAWLGEAGDPTAITALAQTYKNDADPRVKEAAAYSLGMFRKLEQELGGDEDDAEAAMALLQKVALEGKMGGRQRLSTRSIVKLELGLLISAILVAVLAFVLPGIIKGGSSETGNTDNSPTQVAGAADKDRATITHDLRSAFTMLSNNATKLQAQYQLVLGGGKMPCNEFFDNLTSYALSPASAQEFTDLAAIASDINQAETDFATAKSTYDKVCSGTTLSAGDFGGPMGATVAVIQRLATIGTALTTAEASSAGSPTAAPVNVTPTPAPTAVGGGVDLRPHLIALQNIIDNVTAPSGAYTLLNQYWTEAASPTGTQGCSYQFDAGQIPADYALPPEIAPAAPTLKASADLVNTGLGALRGGWDTFKSACANIATTPLTQYTVDSLARMSAAKQAFDLASRQIAGLRGS